MHKLDKKDLIQIDNLIVILKKCYFKEIAGEEACAIFQAREWLLKLKEFAKEDMASSAPPVSIMPIPAMEEPIGPLPSPIQPIDLEEKQPKKKRGHRGRHKR